MSINFDRQIGCSASRQGGFSARNLSAAIPYTGTEPTWVYVPQSLGTIDAPSGSLPTTFEAFLNPDIGEPSDYLDFVESLGAGPTPGSSSAAVAFTESPSWTQTGYVFQRENTDADSDLALAGAEGFTLEAWFQLSHEGCAFRTGVGTSSGLAFKAIDLEAGRYLGDSYILTKCGDTETEETSATIALGDYHHVAMVGLGTDVSLFFNGVQVGSSWTIDSSVYGAALTHYRPSQQRFTDSRNEPPFPGTPTYPERTVQGHFCRFSKFARYSGTFTPPEAP